MKMLLESGSHVSLEVKFPPINNAVYLKVN